MTVSPALEEIYRPVEAELNGVRDLVSALWGDALSLVSGPSHIPPKTGGKLLRPAMCLLSAGAAGSRDLNSCVKLASAHELLHVAALTHDDVVDRASLRRGVMSLNALWDDRTAVLSGDYLVARSMELLVEYDSSALIASTARAVREMTEGELASIGAPQTQYTQEDCIRLAEQKTATFFAATCSAPTFVSDSQYRQVFQDYGIAFGIAFQIIDDILDISQDEATLGKPSCGDICEGKRTIPLLFMREMLDKGGADRLGSLTGQPLSDADRKWIVSAFTESGARSRTESVAREYALRARKALESLPPTLFKESLDALAEFVLVRGS